MNVAEKLVEALLEGDDDKKMPDWLRKKISGKTDDDEGDGEGKDDDGGEKAEKKSSGSKSKSASSSTDVASVTGGVKYSA